MAVGWLTSGRLILGALLSCVLINIAWCLERGIAVVVGTTGFTDERLATVRQQAEKSGHGVLIAANFSIGAVLMMHFAAKAAPFFDSVESVAAHLFFSIPAVKGVEFGGGFSLAAMRGHKANDPIIVEDGTLTTATNRSKLPNPSGTASPIFKSIS